MAKTSQHDDVAQSLFCVSSVAYSVESGVTDKSLAGVAGSCQTKCYVAKVRRGSIKGVNGSVFAGMLGTNGRHGFGQ